MKKFCKLLLPIMLAPTFVVACSNPSTSQTKSSADEAGVSQTDEASISLENETPAIEQGEAILKAEAQDATESEAVVRTAQAHLHGAAQLAVVLEGDLVIVELETPLYNILGFEHAPETEAQITTVKSAEASLVQGGKLFSFNGSALCDYQAKDDDIALFGDHAVHDDDVKKDHAHEDHHDKGHKDVLLQYSFRCQDSSELSMMTVSLFDVFENMSDLDVVYLGPSTQKQVSLNRNQTTVDLTP